MKLLANRIDQKGKFVLIGQHEVESYLKRKREDQLRINNLQTSQLGLFSCRQDVLFLTDVCNTIVNSHNLS